MEAKYNLRSPGVKRLMREAKELHQPTHLYYAQPLEDNLFEWHFTVQGPPDSDFAGGRYHGRIILPPEYPMKPPSIMLLTPNGRFETGKKICLSMSAHHPETWQPSWSIRTVLMALIGFMPTQGAGAIGALDYTPQERKTLAKKSLDWKCNACETCIRTILLEDSGDSSEANKEATELAAQISFKGENEKEKSETKASPSTSNSDGPTQTSTAAINTGVSPQTAALPWTANSLGPFQQYYATYQPWYPYYATGYPMFNAGNTNPLGSQFSTPSSAAMASQNAAVPSAVSPNQVDTVTAQANQSRRDNSSISSVRQRTSVNQINQVVSQNGPAGQNVSRTDTGLVQRQPRVTHSSMASLILIWVLAASIAALVCRRLFMIS